MIPVRVYQSVIPIIDTARTTPYPRNINFVPLMAVTADIYRIISFDYFPLCVCYAAISAIIGEINHI
jgi:hypothetical protein